jgi:hypothetical protein
MFTWRLTSSTGSERRTGLVFQVAQSGTTVWRSPTMAAMLEAAK